MSRKLPSSPDTLAEILSDHGFRTALYSANGFLTETYGMTRGFDDARFIRSETDTLFDGGIDPIGFLHENRDGWSYADLLRECWNDGLHKSIPNVLYYKLIKNWRVHKHGTKNPQKQWDDRIVDRTRSFIRECGSESENFFAFVNLLEAHAKWHFDPELVEAIGVDPSDIAPLERWERIADKSDDKWGYAEGSTEFDEIDREILRYLYESWVHRVDSIAGDILRTLDEEGIRNDTLVVITSDHGEIIAKDGDLGHTTSVGEDVAHVPLVVDGPGIRSGTIDEVVSIKDVFGTVLESTAVDRDADGLLDDSCRGEALVETRGPSDRIEGDKKSKAPHLWGLKRALYRNDGWVERRYFEDTVRGDEELLSDLESLVDSLETPQGEETAREIDPTDSEVADRLEHLGYLD